MSGMTDTGFEIKRLPEILQDFQDNITAVLGELNFNPDSVIGQMLGALAKSPAELWERMQEVYFAPYIDSAEGLQLDQVVALRGIVRLATQPSTILAALWGTPGTTIPAGSQASISDSGEIFSLQADAIIGGAVSAVPVTSAGAIITVANNVPSDTYSIAIGGTIYSYINAGGGGDPVATIAAGLAADIDAGEGNITGTSDGATITLLTTDGETSFELTIWQPGAPPLHFTADSYSIFGTFHADVFGATLVPVESFTVIETPISGWTSVINYIEGVTGRETETDAAVRIRYDDSIAIGLATFEGIRASLLQNVANVTAVNIDENRTDAVVGGVSPHAIVCIVSGGSDQDIADELWAVKPAGIAVEGTESAVVVDSQGQNQTMYFSRPTPVSFRLDVYITAYNTEQTFPTDGFAAIQTAILSDIAALTVGEDVIPQSFFGAIYSVQGIEAVTLTWELGSGAGTPPHANPATDPIEIDPDEIGVATATEITVRDS